MSPTGVGDARELTPTFATPARTAGVRLGLSANWRQFTLLVIVNAFVGAMVGLERAVLPVIAASDFGVASTTAVLSFIATFGLTKALTNLVAGRLMDRRGRRFTLLVGWLLAFPVPLIILWAPTWWWIVAANALLGVNQGLAWSATVIMKIDLVGPRRRGLAMGLNEFAGYLAVAVAAVASGYVAGSIGLRAGPAYLGLAIAGVGFLLSILFVRETADHVALEESATTRPRGQPLATSTLLRRSLWSDRKLFSVSQAGLVNNLNDGLAWGVFPLLFTSAALSLEHTSFLVALYPASWGVFQLVTGALSDRWGRKWLIVIGMLMQGLALAMLPGMRGLPGWIASLIGLGLGTALVYPTLLAAAGDSAPPSWRGGAVGVYRFWRDSGYVVGALVAGTIADAFGMSIAIQIIAALTIISGLLVAARFDESGNRGGA